MPELKKVGVSGWMHSKTEHCFVCQVSAPVTESIAIINTIRVSEIEYSSYGLGTNVAVGANENIKAQAFLRAKIEEAVEELQTIMNQLTIKEK